MKKLKCLTKKLLSAVLSLAMLAATLPTNFTFAEKEEKTEIGLDNGYISAVVSPDNGGFMIRTTDGDKLSKEDDNKDLLYHSDLDDTSFTSFQVTREGETKEYIFGGEYDGSSDVTVSEGPNEITAVWSVDQITFTQTIKLVNAGSNEHGMVYISYQALNQGKPAEIKARVLLDTALGEKDYAYYRVGIETVETEKTYGSDGYDKTFYACDDPLAPQILSYVVNASVGDAECKPYQMQIAHWANLASTVFDYETDKDLTFTNPYNETHMTADSAVAMYYNMGTVAQGSTGGAALNYGVFSHETVDAGTQATFDVTAPEVLELTEDKSAYKDDGVFTVVSNVKNISSKEYSKVRVVVQATKGIIPLDQEGKEVAATYEEPYTYEWIDFKQSQTQKTTWKFKATPEADGIYGKITFKIYDVSDDATLNTGDILAENLLGEGKTYILCPGSVTKVPAIKFTGSAPDTLYVDGDRTLNITGENFSMLVNKSEYRLMVSRVDKTAWNGITEFEIPADSFSIDEMKNTMVIKMDESMPKLAEGRYQITFDYTAADKTDITAATLQFMVKDDVRFKNDAYGLLAVVKDDSEADDIRYNIEKFADEDAYSEYLKTDGVDRDNVLLEFRGSFTLEKKDGANIYTALSRNESDNVVTLNSCLDIEKGTVVVKEKDGTVTVDFDASLYTTGSRTSVFKGVCALTELERGEDYGLIQYDEHGERDEESDCETITLLWPSVGQAAQNLLGMLFDFRYGEFGVMKNEEDESIETRVLAFGASLDLSFVVPDGSGSEDGGSNPLTQSLNQVAQTPGYSANDLRTVNRSIPYNSYTSPRVNTGGNAGTGSNNSGAGQNDEDDEDDEVSASVEINDILFGGKYLGVNFAVEIGVPSLVNGMPEMEATLEINTIGDWSLGVDGECEFASFKLEAGITIKSKNNIPIPDELHFFMGGFIPGINVDGFGILWLQGAGGGIENLYDTVFLKEGVPPLKLIIEAQFSLMQIISARAKLELSLQGIGVELSEGKIANSLEVLENAQLRLNWYPEFYFMSSVNMNVADIIKGGGYIVVEQDGFFEFFVRASIGVPDDVPLVGGVELASVGLGVNTEKIWGKVHVLFVDLGIVYYWGGDFDWGGGAVAEPTYPGLLGEDVPVYQDKESGRTLYASVGTNLTKHDTQIIAGEKIGRRELYADGATQESVKVFSKNVLETDYMGSEYRLTLAPKQKNELITVEWVADSLEEAKQQAEQFTIVGLESKDAYAIKYLDHDKDASSQNANANLTYDSESGKATVCITFTDDKCFNKQWNLRFGDLDGIQVTLYDVGDMPTLSESETEIKIDTTDKSKAQLTLKGKELNGFTNISVFAKKKETNTVARYSLFNRSLQNKMSETNLFRTAVNSSGTNSNEGTLLYYEEKPEGYADGDVLTFAMPQELESGAYDIQIVAKDSNEKYNSSVNTNLIYENPYAPKAVSELSDAKNVGDHQLQITVEKPVVGEFDGYSVTIYDDAGVEVKGLSNMLFNADGSGCSYKEDGTLQIVSDKPVSAELTVGGQYVYKNQETGEQKLIGLEGEKQYQVGIRTWRVSENGIRVTSEERRTDFITVREPEEVKITFLGDKESVVVTESRTTASGEAVTFETPTYADNKVTIVADADSEITGTWKLDNGDTEGSTGEFSKTGKVEIPLEDVADGSHLLTVCGKNANGDSFREVYSFGIDTMAPRMLLSAPISGTVYSNGTLKIEGVTDADAKLTVTDTTTGKTLLNAQSVEVDEEGRFSASVAVDDSVAFHKLTIKVSDAVGNVAEKQVDVLSESLGKIEGLALYANGRDVTNKLLEVNNSYDLQLMAKLKDGTMIEINSETLVDWQETVMEGSAVLTTSADAVTLETSEDSCGMITARYLVNSAGAYSVSAGFTSDVEVVEPEPSTEPAVSEEPGTPTEPGVSAEPDESAKPEVSAEPDDSAKPEVSSDPEVSAEPDKSTEPEVSAEPDKSTEPEASAEPDKSTEPEVSAEPGKSAEPGTPVDPDYSGNQDASGDQNASGKQDDVKASEKAAEKEQNSDKQSDSDLKKDDMQDEKPDSSKKADGSKTGDPLDSMLMLCIMIISGGIAVVAVLRKKEESEQESDS